MKKKILFIINSLDKGGAERVVTNIANHMAEKGCQVTIIIFYNEIYYDINKDIHLYTLNYKRQKNKILRFIQSIKLKHSLKRLLYRLSQKQKYDLITIHLPFAHYLCSNIKIIDEAIFVVHTVYSQKIKTYKFLSYEILRKIYKNKKIITVSQGVSSELVDRFGIKAKSIRTIYNPINLKSIGILKNEKIDFNEKYILFVGRLTKLKRADLLIKSFYESNLYNRYKLVFIGDGEEKENISRIASDMNISDSVILMGWQKNPYKWMKNSNLMVSCSEYEAFPMSIIEALASDAKVVSVDCDYGPREIMINELSEFLVPANSLKLLSLKMISALECYPLDSKKYILKFNIENIVNQYMEGIFEGE